MTEGPRIRALREELAEMRDPGPQDPQGHALYMSIRESLVNDLKDLGAAPEPPSEAAPRRIPVHIHRASSKPIPQEVRHADSPGKAGAPGAISQPEEPMSQPTPGEPKTSPEEQLATLLALLSNATAEASTALNEKAYLKARSHVYQRRTEITKLVKAHSLEEPVLPKIPTNPWARASKTAIPALRVQDAPPQQLEIGERTAPEAPLPPEPLVVDREGRTSPLSRLGTLPPPQERALPEAAARLRAIRSQALEVLPLCEGLDREAAYAVRHQVDLLADVLAMADRLAREAS